MVESTNTIVTGKSFIKANFCYKFT